MLRLAQLFFICFLFSFNSMAAANPFESLIMPGKVITGHKKYESECSNCHEIFSKRGQDKLCLSCHKKVNEDIKYKKGLHGKNKTIKSTSCKSCHTEHKGRKADIIKLDSSLFDHNKTDFRLNGKHKVTECRSCHKKDKKYREAEKKCSSCHDKKNPHKEAKAKKDTFAKCNGCHKESNWHTIKFEHNKNTKFKLTGAHEKALCQSCHINEKYLKTPKLCVSCHKLDDVHDGDNGKKCSKCHTTKKWGKISFNHDRDTSFKLRNKHKKVSCSTCHKEARVTKKTKKNKKKKARKCHSCHSYDDSHDGRFGSKCNECHSDNKWNKPKFKHNKDTDFKIRGKHKKVSCNQCHTSKIKNKELKTTCVSCHKLDDKHKGTLGKKCSSCHSEQSWEKKVKFDHDITKFPLIGMHGAISCNECHSDSNYKKMKKKCVSCHTTDDVHKGQLGENCNKCHTPNEWGVWVFDHRKQTKFKITGAHQKVHCHTCHRNKIKKIKSTPRECKSCHSIDDIHNGQFGARCNDCHTTKDFLQIRMN